MQRDMYDPVTIEILIPAEYAETVGEAYISGTMKDDEGEDEYFERRISIRRFTNEDLDRKTGRGAKTLRQVDPSRLTNILTFVEFIRAVRDKDALASEKALVQLAGALRGEWVEGKTRAILKDPRTGPGFVPKQFAYYLSQNLQGVRLVIWQSSGYLVPGLLCPDIETALLLHSVMSALGGQAGLRLCPKCSKAFLQRRPDKSYCSVKCREAHRVARWRAQKAESLKASVTEKKRSRAKRRKSQ